MLRIFRLSAVGLLLLAAWAALLQQTTEEPARTWVLLVGGRGGAPQPGGSVAAGGSSTPPPPCPCCCPQAPLLALVVFGAYLATALLYGVATFRTVPEEAELLQKVGAVVSGHALKLQHGRGSPMLQTLSCSRSKRRSTPAAAAATTLAGHRSCQSRPCPARHQVLSGSRRARQQRQAGETPASHGRRLRRRRGACPDRGQQRAARHPCGGRPPLAARAGGLLRGLVRPLPRHGARAAVAGRGAPRQAGRHQGGVPPPLLARAAALRWRWRRDEPTFCAPWRPSSLPAASLQHAAAAAPLAAALRLPPGFPCAPMPRLRRWTASRLPPTRTWLPPAQ